MKICQNLQFCWTPCGCHTGRIQYNSGETAAAAICIQTYNTPLMAYSTDAMTPALKVACAQPFVCTKCYL